MEIGSEEKKIFERIKNLERDYKEKTFSEDFKERIEDTILEDIKDSSKEEKFSKLNPKKGFKPEKSADFTNFKEDKDSENNFYKEIIEEEPVIEEEPKENLESLKDLDKLGILEKPKPDMNEIKEYSKKIQSLKKEISKVIVGQEEIVDGLIIALICNSHAVLEGVPGVAKTLMVKSLAKAVGCEVKRVQFTADMLPSDIIGITSYSPKKGFETIKGPIFTNFLIADEINRSPPKTQSALIEAMQERQVTIGRETFKLHNPFFVMATMNPLEALGVYSLPEAQIDRFLLKLQMSYPEKDEELKIMEQNTTIYDFDDFEINSVLFPEDIVKIQKTVRNIYASDSVKSYILAIIRKTREKDFQKSEYIALGSSPRASIGLLISSKARALIKGRNFVLPEDVKKVAYPVLRHRLILSYKAVIEKINPDSIINEILSTLKVE